MRTIDALLSEYGESHRNETNKLIHWICVPLIFFSVIGLLASIPAMPVQYIFGSGSPFANWAGVLMVPVFIYYLVLSRPLGLGMILFSIACFYIAHWIGTLAPLWLVSAMLFAVAWVFQFVGHHIEGKKPSFLKDLQFLLIGPAWLLHFVYKKLGVSY